MQDLQDLRIGFIGSIAKHTEAVASVDGGARLHLYRPLCAATVRIASQGGVIDAATALRFEKLLAEVWTASGQGPLAPP